MLCGAAWCRAHWASVAGDGRDATWRSRSSLGAGTHRTLASATGNSGGMVILHPRARDSVGWTGSDLSPAVFHVLQNNVNEGAEGIRDGAELVETQAGQRAS